MPEEKKAEKDWPHDFTPRTSTIRGRRYIDSLFKSGKRISGKYLVLIYRNSCDGETRYSVFIPRRLGNPVRRNRARRAIREHLRIMSHPVVCGKDIIILCRKPVSEETVRKAKEELGQILNRLATN
ncbi:MAG TPA: ribonuclease P protein component [bacterium]|nr:ribonuclease P protein component [bacterium]